MTTAASQPGLASTLRSSPATAKLLDETTKLAKAGGGRLVGKLGERVTSTTDKLSGVADNDGQTSVLSDGVRRLAEGESPAKAAAGTAMSSVTNKVKDIAGRIGGSSTEPGPPKVTTIEEAIDVGVPVSTAYDQWTQFPDFARFAKGVEQVDIESETEQNWRIRVFKSHRTWKATTVDAIPDRRISWTSEGAKGTTNGAATFHPLADDLTRILLTMEYYPSGFMEKTGDLWRAGGRRARLDLKNFRRFLVFQTEPTGSWRGEIRDGEVVRQPDDADQDTDQDQDQENGDSSEADLDQSSSAADEEQADSPEDDKSGDADQSDSSQPRERDRARA